MRTWLIADGNRPELSWIFSVIFVSQEGTENKAKDIIYIHSWVSRIYMIKNHWMFFTSLLTLLWNKTLFMDHTTCIINRKAQDFLFVSSNMMKTKYEEVYTSLLTHPSSVIFCSSTSSTWNQMRHISYRTVKIAHVLYNRN